MRFKYWFFEDGGLNPMGKGDASDPSVGRSQSIYLQPPDEAPGLNKKRIFNHLLKKGPINYKNIKK